MSSISLKVSGKSGNFSCNSSGNTVIEASTFFHLLIFIKIDLQSWTSRLKNVSSNRCTALIFLNIWGCGIKNFTNRAHRTTSRRVCSRGPPRRIF